MIWLIMVLKGFSYPHITKGSVVPMQTRSFYLKRGSIYLSIAEPEAYLERHLAVSLSQQSSRPSLRIQRTERKASLEQANQQISENRLQNS